jgi:hypothetical protein
VSGGSTGALLASPFNMKWRCYEWPGGVEDSKFCIFSVVFPARCVSSISPRFYFRRHVFCFLPLAAILESPCFYAWNKWYFIILKKSVSTIGKQSSNLLMQYSGQSNTQFSSVPIIAWGPFPRSFLFGTSRLPGPSLEASHLYCQWKSKFNRSSLDNHSYACTYYIPHSTISNIDPDLVANKYLSYLNIHMFSSERESWS